VDGGSGIGGWLAVFMLYQTLTTLAFMGGVLLARSPGLDWFTLVVAAYALAVALGLRLIMLRSRNAPGYWIALLVAQIFCVMLLASLGSMTSASLLRNTLWPVVWMLYWMRSKRVRATFSNAQLMSGT
jgi:hypothetical protein